VLALGAFFLFAVVIAPFVRLPIVLSALLPSLFLLAIAGNVIAWYALSRSLRVGRTDGLTGLANRHTFDETVEAQLALAKRSAQPLAIIMIDVDWFKKYNDFYGHPAGDEALQLVARSLAKTGTGAKSSPSCSRRPISKERARSPNASAIASARSRSNIAIRTSGA
jgi:hypothetical protein